jgi:RNA polymerase sigma-70 factor (ECF subfamily)
MAERQERGTIVRKCLSELSVIHREVLDLVYYHEKSVKEVAQIVGVPESTVKTRMFYARKRMETMLETAGVDRQ